MANLQKIVYLYYANGREFVPVMKSGALSLPFLGSRSLHKEQSTARLPGVIRVYRHIRMNKRINHLKQKEL